MFIQTEAMPDPTRMKFFPGEAVLPSGQGAMAEFPDEESADRSPLARRLFEIDGVETVTLYDTFITVTREDGFDWQVLKPMVLGAIMDHYTSGLPAIQDSLGAEAAESLEYPYEDDPKDADVIKQVHELMDSRIRPAAQQMGGDVTYKGFHDGVLFVQFIGPTRALAGGMGNLFAHFIPEVTGVKDYRDAIPKPGLDTDEGKAVQQILEDRINPAVAGHGGHIQLIDVRDHTAFLRLEGGCQGCGAADVTLKQGIEVEIMSAVPSITRVLDVTDHAAGTNPYYSA